MTELQELLPYICGLLMLVGLIGVIIPVLPGVALCWISVLVWAVFSDAGWLRWLFLAAATLIAMIGWGVKYLWPGHRLKQAGVPTASMLIGGLLGLVGFFVVPIIGLVLGFILGIFLSERIRLGDNKQAWESTKHALKAAGLSMLIEMGAAVSIVAVWIAGLIMA